VVILGRLRDTTIRPLVGVAQEAQLHRVPLGVFDEMTVLEKLACHEVLETRPTYPTIVDLTEQLALLATDEEFVRGLDRILAGLKIRVGTRSRKSVRSG
jgi:hypothetical protein